MTEPFRTKVTAISDGRSPQFPGGRDLFQLLLSRAILVRQKGARSTENSSSPGRSLDVAWGVVCDHSLNSWAACFAVIYPTQVLQWLYGQGEDAGPRMG